MICLDISRLTDPDIRTTPLGIDRVEYEYARHVYDIGGHFVALSHGNLMAVPRWLVGELLDALRECWTNGSDIAPMQSKINDWRSVAHRKGAMSTAASFLERLKNTKSLKDRFAIAMSERGYFWDNYKPLPPILIAGAVTLAPGLIARALNPKGPEPRFDHDVPAATLIYLNVGHTNLERPSLLARIKAEPGARVIYYMHDILPLSHPEHFNKEMPAKTRARFENLCKFADVILSNSHFTKGEIARLYPDLTLGPVLEIGTPKVPVSKAKDRRGFVCVGTIEPRKRQLFLAETWVNYCRANPEKTKGEVLTIYGRRGWLPPSDMARLEALEGESAHLRIQSGAGDQAIQSAMAEARAYISAAEVEGWGMPLAEALSLGTPVIATDTPAHREVTQGVADFFEDAPGLIAAFEAHLAGFKPVTGFQRWTWDAHFAKLDGFLKSR